MAFTAAQLDTIVADVPAILRVGGVKRFMAVSIPGDRKAVDLEVRRKDSERNCASGARSILTLRG